MRRGGGLAVAQDRLAVDLVIVVVGADAAQRVLELAHALADGAAGLGTGGTLMGVGRRLKEEREGVKIVAAEPMQGEPVQGLRSLEDGFIPPIIDLSLLDRKIFVTNHDAIVWT